MYCLNDTIKLRSLSKEELIEEIIWSDINARTRSLEPRYEGQSKDEQYKEYCELHAVYERYFDEAVRRGMTTKKIS